MSIDRFLDVPSVDLDSLVEEEQKQNILNHGPSNRNRAAIASVLSDSNSPQETYKQINIELDEEGVSHLENSIVERAKKRSLGSVRDDLISFLNHPEISDEHKRDVVQKVLNDKDEMYSPQKLLANKFLQEESGDESVIEEGVRIDAVKAIDDVLEYKREAQTLLVFEAIKGSNELSGLLVDVADMIAPFSHNARVASIRDQLREQKVSKEGDPRGLASVFLTFVGEDKKELRDTLKRMPADQRLEAARKLVEIINNVEVPVYSDNNDIERLELLRVALEDGFYSDEMATLDSIFTLFDYVGAGSSFKKLFKGADILLGKGAKAFVKESQEAFMRGWQIRKVKEGTQPTSVASIAKDTNPEKARAFHKAAVEDDTGEVAKAVYGSSREDAIAHDLLPDPKQPAGSVANKVGNIEKHSVIDDVDPEVMDMVKRDGAIHLTETDIRKTNSLVFNNFAEVTGVTAKKEMMQVGQNADGALQVDAIYGNGTHGFSNAQEAMDRTKFALRSYGIKDDEITILSKTETGEYMPVKGIPTEEGDYLAQVSYTGAYDAATVKSYESLDVVRNWFDQKAIGTGDKAGSLQRHLLDAASMLNPRLTKGSAVAIEKAAGLERELLRLGDSFGKGVRKLPKESQEAIMDYVKEANLKGLSFDVVDLKARGFSDKEISLIADWRHAWDTVYALENRDWVKTLSARGYHVLEDAKTDTKLFAKPISKGSFKNKTVYDPINDELVNLSKVELEELYAKNGSIAALKDPVKIGDDLIDNIIVKNTSDSYLRALRDTDEVLAYRQGYYTVRYEAPFYIDKLVKGADGTEYSKAIAVAGTRKEAEMMAKNFAKEDPDSVFTARADKKATPADSDDYWSLQNSGGRNVQRIRGTRLEEASSPALTGDSSYVMNPIDSMIASMRSTANRVAMRDYLETSKQRFLQQYSDVLKHGDSKWPSLKEIGKEGQETGKKVGDARTTWEYLNFLENGYINSLDDSVQGLMKGLADHLGGGKAEKLVRQAARGKGITGLLKNVAFQSYIALNPMRQFVIQSHQALQLIPNYGDVVLRPRFALDLGALMIAEINPKLAKQLSPNLDVTIQNFRKSGISAGIDKNNLIQGSLLELTDNYYKRSKSLSGKAVNLTGEAVRTIRKVGFDAGETVNMMTAWLAAHNKALKANRGKPLTQRQLDEITAEARNYTYNMNRAGDMPYNHNTLGLVFQFMQVPHKALLGMATNRQLTKAQKGRLIAFNAIMTGTIGQLLMSSGHLPEDPELRDGVLMGLEGYALNKGLSLMFDEESRTDFSSLAAVDVKGMYEFVHNLIAGDTFATIVSNAPSTSLFMGTNPRISEAFKSAARYFGVVEDFKNPTTALQVLEDFAKISSGWSNTTKARTILKARQTASRMKVTDEVTTTPEALMKALGFATMDEVMTFAVSKKRSEGEKEVKKEVEDWYKQLTKHMVAKNIDPQSAQFRDEAFSEVWTAWGEDQRFARKHLVSLITRDMRNGTDVLVKNLIQSIGLLESTEVREMIKTLPNISEEKRSELLKIVDNIDKLK